MYLIRLFFALFLCLFSVVGVNAEDATATGDKMSPYLKMEPASSPVLIANITDRSGNLNIPLSTTFRVTTNSTETKKLYLKSNTVTDGGYEESMFERDGVVYIAFGNLTKIPTSQSLMNCKNAPQPKNSPRIVAYPVIAISGAEYSFNKSINKYEINIENGTTYINVLVGATILPSSFGRKDSKGLYQAVLSLTEADI